MSGSNAFSEGLLLGSRRPELTVPLLRISEFTSDFQHKIRNDGLVSWYQGIGVLEQELSLSKSHPIKIHSVFLALK
jgi:hypothetical protein